MVHLQMWSPAPRVSRRTALALGLTVALASETAWAAGRVVWTRKKIKEGAVAWRLRLEIHLSRAPSVSLLPLKFSFTPVTYFERSLVDGREEPVVRNVPLTDQQAIVERVDAGFRDPATGKTVKRTRFTFDVDRDHGFAAGVYEVKVVDSRTDKQVGAATRITLEGENKVIDRRSMVMDAPKKASEKASTDKEATQERELTPEDDAYWEGGSRAPEPDQSPLPPPAHLQQKPGCSCRVSGGGQDELATGIGLSTVAALWLRRRRRLASPATNGVESTET